MNFPDYAFVNMPSHIERMAKLIQDAGVKPEMEVFDLGHVRLAANMVQRGVIKGEPLFQLCLGIPWTAPATPAGMMAMVGELPPGATWAAFGISSQEFPMVAQACCWADVRVGPEDPAWTLCQQQCAARGRSPGRSNPRSRHPASAAAARIDA
jgi:uncharacterized protein (DUF849 family)